MEGRLSLEISAIDRQVLNLFGAGAGWDFGQTTCNGRSLVDISQHGTVLAADGKLTCQFITRRLSEMTVRIATLRPYHQLQCALLNREAERADNC